MNIRAKPVSKAGFVTSFDKRYVMFGLENKEAERFDPF
jgi:hypothetical protein